MASKRLHALPFALRLVVRGAVAGGLIVAAALLLGLEKPVSAALALMLAVLVGHDLLRVAWQAERAMEDLVEQLVIGADDQPIRLDPAFHALDAKVERALTARRAERIGHAEQIDALEALLDTVPAALLVTDEGGEILLANRLARSLATGGAAHLARHGAFAPDDAAALAAAHGSMKHMLRLSDGRSALVSVALFTLADGTRRRLVSVQIVAEQLGVVETHAWHDLSRVLAHEMMNSLSPVISLAESMAALLTMPENVTDRAELAEGLELMARRAIHLMSFVERYRAMMEIPEAVPTPVGMADFGRDLARLAQANASDLTVEVRVDPPDLVVAMDRELMEQALINLLKNATEAVAGTPDPSIHLAMFEEEGAVLIEVTDNGPGLPTDADALFLPFYTTKSKGSGIGLAVARQIAHAHGGTLTAGPHSHGARFALKLPGGHQQSVSRPRNLRGRRIELG